MEESHSGTGRVHPVVVPSSDGADAPHRRAIDVIEVWHKLVYGKTNGSYRRDDSMQQILRSNLETRESHTLEFLKLFVEENEAIPTSWVIGVLVDEFSDKDVRDFCQTALLLGPLAERFERDELLGFSKGLYRYLSQDEQLSDLRGARRDIAKSVLTLTAIVWVHAPESLTDAVTDDPNDGIYLTDRRTAELVISDPQRTNEIVEFVKQYEVSKYEDIVRYFDTSPALREGVL